MAIKFLTFLCLIFTYMFLASSRSEDLRSFDGRDDGTPVEAEERHVVVLKQSNFREVIEKNKFVMVDFYAPWSPYSQALAPEYAATAAELKDEAVVLAKVSAYEEWELGRKFDVQGFPTMSLFVNGLLRRTYYGERTKDAIVCWLKKKIVPGLNRITTMQEALDILMMFEDKLVLGYLESLVGPESEELAAAAKLEEDFNFYQTTNPNMAKLFYVDPQAKRPSLVLLQNGVNHLNKFSGEFTKTAIAEFLLEKKLHILAPESAPTVLENPIKKHIFGDLSAGLFKGKVRKWLINLF